MKKNSNLAKENYRTWIEISKEAIKKNYQAFRKLLRPATRLMGVVKSNAYGHGLVGYSQILDNLGIDWLGVDSIVEAKTLREQKIKSEILVLGYTLPENFRLAWKNEISLTISSIDSLKILLQKKFPLKVHLKIETGLNRQGFKISQIPEIIRLLRYSPKIKIEGVYTHFAEAYFPSKKQFTYLQLNRFEKAVKVFHGKGLKPIRHTVATAGVMNFPEAHLDMARVGIGMYGLWPSQESRQAHFSSIKLSPVLTWKTRIAEIKIAEAGETVGYNRTKRLTRKSRLAVLPVGYWHGFDRRFSNTGTVLIRGKRAKVLGRVSMDMTVVDVSAIRAAKVGDEVVLLGQQGQKVITAEDLANTANTINYEIVTRINPLIEKFYL